KLTRMCFMMSLQINHTMSLLCALCTFKVVNFFKVFLERLAPKFHGHRKLTEGKEMISKQIIEAIHEEKQMITFIEFEGDIVSKYENFKATLHIDAKDDTDLVCWTLEYERPNEDLPELISLIKYIVSVTKDVDDHHVNMN
ncbi:hypothetical protein EJD97_025792, partial [Solanum chilense]